MLTNKIGQRAGNRIRLQVDHNESGQIAPKSGSNQSTTFHHLDGSDDYVDMLQRARARRPFLFGVSYYHYSIASDHFHQQTNCYN